VPQLAVISARGPERSGPHRRDRRLEAEWGDRYWDEWRFPNYHAMDPHAFGALGAALFDQTPLGARLAEIRCPTLVLVGSGDTGFLAAADELVRDIPGARLARIPEAAHQPPKTSRLARRSARSPARARVNLGCAPLGPVTAIERFSTDTMMQSVFRDHYALDAEKLESLYSKSKRHQWNAELDVDWDAYDPSSDVLDRSRDFLSRLDCVRELPEDLQTRLFREAATFTLSQVLHGEQAALMVCGQLVNVVPDLDGKFAAAVQVMDRRVMSVFAPYLGRVSHRYPDRPDLKAIVGRSSPVDWEAKCVMQVIWKRRARLLPLRRRMAREPVLAVYQQRPRG
jgi:hypothetical protein